MNAKETFAVGVRLIGLLGIMYVIRSVVRSNLPEIPIEAWIIKVVCLGIGLYMLRGAPPLVRFAFPEKPGEVADKP